MVKQKHGVGQDLFIGVKDGTTQVMVYLSGAFPANESNYIVGETSNIGQMPFPTSMRD